MPYFDHNATTPLSRVARETWLRAQDEAWQNPSSLHRGGAQARIRLDAAREKLAILCGGRAEDYVFTSGATESANLVLAHWARVLPADARVGLNPAEHPCVREAAYRFFGDRVILLDVDADGVARLDVLKRALADKTIAAVAVMAANNETGVLQPWTEIAAACRAAGVPYLCDAAQWLGKLPAGGLAAADFFFGAAHKLGGPKGVGFLKLGTEAEGLRGQAGGAQENGHRAGTEDFPGVAAMVAALAEAEMKKVFLESERVRWREDFERAALAAVPGARVAGRGAERLWNTVSLVMPAGENTRWVTRLDKRGFQVSTGSACAAGKAGPSAVLAAMGFSDEEARRVVRVSAGWDTTPEEWSALAEALAATAAEIGV